MTVAAREPGVAVRPSVVHDLPPRTLSVRAARAIVAETLKTLPDDTRQLCQLLTSELATNAVMHARSGLRLQIEIADDVVRVSVEDASLGHPEKRTARPIEAGGRGLALVDALASSWGWEQLSAGKRVWFELPIGANRWDAAP